MTSGEERLAVELAEARAEAEAWRARRRTMFVAAMILVIILAFTLLAGCTTRGPTLEEIGEMTR